jgi:hypothetical protein
MHHQLGLMTLLGVPQRLHVAPAQCPIAGFDLAIFGGDTGDSAPFLPSRAEVRQLDLHPCPPRQ